MIDILIFRPGPGQGNHWMVRFYGEYGEHYRRIHLTDQHPTPFTMTGNDAEDVVSYYRRAYPGFKVEAIREATRA